MAFPFRAELAVVQGNEDMLQIKKCRRCKETKPLKEFSPRKILNNGYYSICKKCQNARAREWANSHKDRVLENHRRWLKLNPGKPKEYHLRQTHGISLEEMEAMLEAQNNKCAICQKPFTKKSKPYIDHCHKTGKIRGLVHVNCNSLLGMAHDDIKILSLAIEYLNSGNDQTMGRCAK